MKAIQLSKPPIREAIFDIQVSGEIDIDRLREIVDSYGAQHNLQKVVPIRVGTFGFAIAPGEPMTTHAHDEGIIGFRLEDEPTTRVVQLKKNGFTYSHTGAYDDWESFRERAMIPARIFLAIAGVERITRIALRYINVINLPGPRVDLDEYLPAAPKIPGALPQSTSGFFSRIVLPLPDDQLTAVVTQALEESPQPTPSVILDIDIFRQLDLSPSDTSWEQMFEAIREWKNRIFFEFVNEKTVALYK